MAKTRRRLTKEERSRILYMYGEGEKIDFIAALLNKSVSTITRCAAVGETPRKIGRPRSAKHNIIKEAVVRFIRDNGEVRASDLVSLMSGINGQKEKWDIIEVLKKEGRIVTSGGRGFYKLAEGYKMKDLRQDIFEEVLGVLCRPPSDFGETVQMITDRVWGVVQSEMGAGGLGGSAGSQPVDTAKTSEEASLDKDDKRQEAEKQVADAVNRIQKVRDSGTPDPTSGGFFI